MTGPGRQRGQLMLILIGALIFGGTIAAGVAATGKPVGELRKQAQSLQLADSREAEVLAIFDRWEYLIKPVSRAYHKQTDAVIDLMEDQGATREQFLERLSTNRSDFQALEQDVLDLREELRAALRKDEWDRLFEPRE